MSYESRARLQMRLVAIKKYAAAHLSSQGDWKQSYRNNWKRNRFTANGGSWQTLESMKEKHTSPRDRAYYCDDFNNFRNVRDADKVSTRQRHTGWYTDQFQDDMAVGVVLQLPARHGKPIFVPGVRFSGSSGVTAYPLDQYDDEIECARAADHFAEHIAEEAREYAAQDQAKQDILTLKEEIAEWRQERRKLVAELHDVKRRFGIEQFTKRYPSLVQGVCGKIADLKEKSKEAYERIKKLEDNYWEAVS